MMSYLKMLWDRKKKKVNNTIATIAKAKLIVKSSRRILALVHDLQNEYDLTETEVRLVFLHICEDLAKDKVTEFHREPDNAE